MSKHKPINLPVIQTAPPSAVDSLAYSLDTSQDFDSVTPPRPYEIKRMQGLGMSSSADDNGTYSVYNEEMSRMSAYNQYQEQHLPTVNEYQMNTTDGNEVIFDATETVHDMHRKLLYLLSNPELFTEALIWESKLDCGLDPSKPDDDHVGEGGGNGIKSFENELAVDEHKDEEEPNDEAKVKDQKRLLPPLPSQIFTADAEVVLPQALTATQLFGMERVTGIELEAAAGIAGLSHLFLRWLALMPEGDHMNMINPPGLTVMRISGGRYRVTAAHRVVWRWMNKFSFSDAMFQGNSDATDPATASIDNDGPKDTDFDFGDLVTMTIIDVFETDVDGKLLSYCPTFDNRAVHKTQEVTERIRKGASQFKETIQVIAKSPAGQSAAHAAEDLQKKGLSAAFKGFNLVRNKIETEIHKHQHPKTEEKNVAASAASSDAVGGEDIWDEASEKEEAYGGDEA